MKIHWFDSETTGVSFADPRNPHQMLTYAMVSTDVELNQVGMFNEKIRLLPEVTPTKEALAVNKIDPYSLEWHMSAMDEKDFCRALNKYLDQHYSDGDVFIAYRAKFDNTFTRLAFERSKQTFLPLERTANVITLDPLIMVQEATRAGKLATPQKKDRSGQWYRSSTLDDVSALLQTFKGPAHTALGDVYTLLATTPKVYKLTTGEDFSHFLKQNKYRVQF